MGAIRRGVRRFRRALTRRKTITVEAQLVEPITWDVYDRACYALGLDPDTVRDNPEKALEEMDKPTMSQMQAFLEVVLSNAKDFDLRNDFDLPAANQFVQGMLAFFLRESNVSSTSRRSSLAAFLQLYSSQFLSRKAV